MAKPGPTSPPPPQPAVELLRRHGEAVEQYLRSLRARYDSAPTRCLDAIEYSLMAGGKRLRPALVLECAVACVGGGGWGVGRKDKGTFTASASASPPTPHSLPPTPSSALPAAGAIELIHTFSLVHDDLPAMDDDDLRRGRPTNHKVFGEAMAILVGDAMVTMAFDCLSTDAEPAVVPALVRELASASGPAGMIGGQVLDIDNERVSLSLEQLQHVHRMKTGALLTCACRMGAIATGAGESALAAVTTYGRHLGLAFQIVDDLLDVTSTPEQLGKATKKDAGKGKNTYPGLLGLEGSRAEARVQMNAALDALSDFGPAAEGLRNLVKFVVERNA